MHHTINYDQICVVFIYNMILLIDLYTEYSTVDSGTCKFRSVLKTYSESMTALLEYFIAV